MDGGARRGRFRRQARGHRGAQQQAPRAGVAPGGGGGGARGWNGGRGGARGGNGGRGGARGGNGGRGGGRVGNGGGDGARAGNAVGGQLHGQRRGWLPDPRLRDWFANSQFVNPSGLTVEDFEYGLDAFLAKKPRIDLKELNVYFIPRDHRQQGEDAVRLLADVNFSLHKFALTRKILLRFYVDGDYTSSGADYWRRRMEKQKKVLQDQLDALDRDLRMPSIFSTSLCLLPKEK